MEVSASAPADLGTPTFPGPAGPVQTDTPADGGKLEPSSMVTPDSVFEPPNASTAVKVDKGMQ